ncbi:proline dehydrogenase family protein [bacterium]|nr:proline dehydrogenase family protein [bacterium]
MMWFNRLIVGVLPVFPKSLVWLFARRYTAGKTLEEAVRKARELNDRGLRVTMDVLGEDIRSLDEASAAREQCLVTLDAIRKNGLQGNLSLKLTQLGLKLDPETCYQNLKTIVQSAKSLGLFVRIDMEDSSCTAQTLSLYRRIRKEFDNTGAVIQAYMKRSRGDVQDLIRDSLAHLRVCKGIYDEPAAVAYKKKNEIRESFMDLIRMMLDSKSFIGIATHDSVIIERSLDLIHTGQVQKKDYEFQMLLGVTEKLRRRLVEEGHAVRVYVPYGEQWYQYSMRRLKENPNVAGHIVKNLFIRG